MILLAILSAVLIQGEKSENNKANKERTPLNLQYTLETESESSQPNEEQESTLDDKKPLDQDFRDPTQPDKWLGTPFK